MQLVTTPDSGIPRKKRAANNPDALFTVEILITMVPHKTIINGKKFFADIFFINRLDGMSSAVTAK
jgi:hypothetical protein